NTLTIDYSNGTFSQPVSFDGGTGPGSHTLTLQGGMALSDTYTLGPDLGQATATLVLSSGTQKVSFVNVQSVLDLVSAAALAVAATSAGNAINYTQGPSSGTALVGGATTGQVTVDSLVPIEFASKTTLTLNAGAGDDTINLNPPGLAPPTGLTQVNVNGG